ncbi:hypothetical protein [Cryptosporangium aurantiacum]|uniref:hypothetical protein n=1 Tax=Cryptosporangium aurantiacum TaxID=134849 RepID=UPI00116136C0|nr:hypothetical protein [Cryptosporangium aurantiacum]
MTDVQSMAVATIRLVLETIRKMTPDQVEQALEGTGKVSFIPPGAEVVVQGPDAAKVEQELGAVGSRSEANEYLAQLNLGRAQLISLAKQLRVGVRSRDNMETIREKIVEATAGAVLDSAAIHRKSGR